MEKERVVWMVGMGKVGEAAGVGGEARGEVRGEARVEDRGEAGEERSNGDGRSGMGSGGMAGGERDRESAWASAVRSDSDAALTSVGPSSSDAWEDMVGCGGLHLGRRGVVGRRGRGR